MHGARRRSRIVEKLAITTWKYCGRPAAPVRHVPRRMTLPFYPAEETFRRQDIRWSDVARIAVLYCGCWINNRAGMGFLSRCRVQFLRLSLAYRRETRDDHCFRKVAPAYESLAHENFKRTSGSIGRVYTRCPRNRGQKVIYNGILMVSRAKLDRWMTWTFRFRYQVYFSQQFVKQLIILPITYSCYMLHIEY